MSLLKFKIWILTKRVKNRYIKIYNSYFVKKIRQSFIFNFIKILFFVHLILVIYFSCIPYKAHINMETQIGDIYGSCKTFILQEAQYHVTIKIDEKCKILPLYDNLKIYKTDPDKDIYLEFYASDINCTLADYPYVEFLSKQLDEMDKTKTDSFKFEYNANRVLKFDLLDNAEIMFRLPPNSIPSVKNGEIAYMRGKDEFSLLTNIPFTTFSVMGPTSCTINIIDGDPNFYFRSHNIGGNLTNTTLTVSRTTKNDTYIDTWFNDYYFESEENGGFNINISKNSLIVNGMANRAEINDDSIFPSYKQWILDNVYIIPLSLIATIFSGISIQKKY